MPSPKLITADDVTLSYLAGVFDGEGCVSVSIQKKNTCLLSVSVVMTDRQAVDLFFEVFGGSFKIRNDNTKKGKSKTVYTWKIYNAESAGALGVFSKYCRVKKEVSKKGLELALKFSAGKAGPSCSIEEKRERLALMVDIKALVGRSKLDEDKVESFLTQRNNGAKSVVTDTGMSFKSQSEAARFLGVHTTAINSAVIKGHKCCGMNWSKIQ